MADAPSVTIPDKPAFKASEVCELAQIQPYVLRSWESEFPELGLSKTPGGPRIYRRTDVERVLRIRDLVFTEGLTLSGVRRRFDAEQPQPQDDLFTLRGRGPGGAGQGGAGERRTPDAERRSRTIAPPSAERRTPRPNPRLGTPNVARRSRLPTPNAGTRPRKRRRRREAWRTAGMPAAR